MENALSSARKRASRPSSEGLFAEALTGILLSYGLILALLSHGVSVGRCAGIGIVVYAIPQIVSAVVKDWGRIGRAINFTLNQVVMTKLLGVAIIYGLLFAGLLAAWALGLERFGFGALVLANCIPAVALLAVPYVCTADRLDGSRKDAYFDLGRLAMGDYRAISGSGLRELLLGWFIKGFFGPLMLWEYLYSIRALDSQLATGAITSFDLFNAFNASIYFIDVLIAVSGYLFTLRLLRWEIRSVNPSVIGWFVTLLCYYPFFGIVYRSLLEYQDPEQWNDWLSSSPWLLIVWGVAIAILKIVWILAVLPFGLRFSNLTNRGIFTNGAFLLGKHPSYVAKNSFWWLIHMPFLSAAGPWEAFENSAQLAVINFVYWLRAYFEEKHLWEEPRYRAYARWIAKYGLIARTRRILRLDQRWTASIGRDNASSR